MVLIEKLENIWNIQEGYIPFNLSHKKLNISPAIKRDKIKRIKSAGENQSIIIATWYIEKAKELRL